jgi:hypothetical protein
VGARVTALDASARAQQVGQALTDFDHDLAALASPRGTSLHLQLAGGLTRWQIVPFNASLRGAQQHRLFAQHCFVQACGERARHWSIQVQQPGWNRSTLACAIDTSLLDGLAARALQAGRRIGRIEPALSAAHDAVRRVLGDAAYWFVLVEAGLSTALFMSDGEPRRIKPAAAGVDLGRLLDREWFALGLTMPRCPVVLVGDEAGAVGDLPGWTVVRPADRSTARHASGPLARLTT